MNSRKIHGIVCRVSEIKSRQWVERRPLTSVESSEIARLREKITAPPWSKEELAVFSKVMQAAGVEIIESPENKKIIMFSKDKVWGFNLDEISPDELIEQIGVAKFSIGELLYSIREGAQEVKYALEREDNARYWEVGSVYAPSAYALYQRLSSKGEEPRISIHLATNRFQSTKRHPTTIHFWADPDAILGLYESLEADGYYVSKITAASA